MKIGSTIRMLRKESGLSQIELGEIACLTQTALSQIESNEKRPGTKTLENLSSALGVPVPIIYLLSFERTDVDGKYRVLFDRLYPIATTLFNQLYDVRKHKTVKL